MRPQILAAALSVLPAFAALAQPLTTAFTFQGRLDAAGSPANGAYDLRFALFDQISAGSQQGPTLCFNNVAVANGLFTVQLDFGAQFTNQQRFLDVSVRPDAGLDCSSSAGFTTLSPRKSLDGSPFALSADRLDGLDSSSFVQTSGAQTIAGAKNFTGFVGIGRSTTVTGAEVFGLQADVTTPGFFGGMYVQTQGAQTRPFYGYSVGNGATTAYSYLDGNDNDKLKFNNGGDYLSIDRAGVVAAGVLNLNGGASASLVFNPGTGPLINAGQDNSVDKRMWIAHSDSFPAWGIQYRDISSDGFSGDSVEFVAGNQTRPSFGFVLSSRTLRGYDGMGATTVSLNATTGAAQFNGGVSQSYAGIVQRATPVAFGVVDPSGLSLNGSTNNVAFSSWDSANSRYEIPITGETYTATGYSTVVTPLDNGVTVIPATSVANGHLIVIMRNLVGNRVQNQFSFVVYKP